MIDVSVIVPIFNVELYVERCIRSLFTQTKTDGVEYIIVNDCTPDGSMAIVERLISEFNHLNVIVINNKTNQGIGATRCVGFSAANGEYIIYTDSDDWCEPTMIEDLYTKAKDSKADIVGCDYYLNYATQQKYIAQELSENPISNVNCLLSGRLHGSLCNKLVKHELYLNNNISITPNLNMWEDLVVSIMLFSCAGKVAHHPKAYLHYRQHEASLVHAVNDAKILGYVTAINIIDEFLHGRDFYNSTIEHLLIAKKTRVNYTVLSSYCGADKKKHAKLFPEIKPHIMSIDSMSFYKRLLLYFATNVSWLSVHRLIQLLRKIRNIGKK